MAGLTPGQAAGRAASSCWCVGLLLKNALGYASSQISVGVQEGLVRDLRTRIFDHLLTLDLGYFQRTRAGQLISGIITEVDQTKTVITASLALAVPERRRRRDDAGGAEPDLASGSPCSPWPACR